MRTPLLHETLREWWVKFSSLFADGLRSREGTLGFGVVLG